MKTIRIAAIGLALLGLSALHGPVRAASIEVVAAEAVYGDIAGQIGGDRVSVVSILNNPAQDPHLFEADASAARAVAEAKLAIYNGADYDPWMAKLLAVSSVSGRATVVAADLAHIAPGNNPHLWYEPAVMQMVAKAVADRLKVADPGGAEAYAARLAAFDRSITPLMGKIATMRSKYAGMAVTATEPVFDYMARTIGLQIRNPAFQRAVMNDTEPSARDIAAFEDDLKGGKVKALLYNVQAVGPLTERMRRLAEAANIPVVAITETEPPGMRYQDWMIAELDRLDAALSRTAP